MKQRFVSRTQKGVSRWQNSVSRKSVRENLVHADDYVGGKVPPGFGTMVYGPELGVSSFLGGGCVRIQFLGVCGLGLRVYREGSNFKGFEVWSLAIGVRQGEGPARKVKRFREEPEFSAHRLCITRLSA